MFKLVLNLLKKIKSCLQILLREDPLCNGEIGLIIITVVVMDKMEVI